MKVTISNELPQFTLGHRQSACKTPDIPSERRRDRTQFFERKIPLSALHAAHVAPVDVCAISKVLLRPTAFFACARNPAAENFRRPIFFHPLAASVFDWRLFVHGL